MKNKYICIPVNGLVFLRDKDDKDVFERIAIDEINEIASLAITLEPEPAVHETVGYMYALQNHFNETKDERSTLLGKLTSNFYGGEFLCSTIALYLLEKKMRENGVSDDLIKRYASEVNKYRDMRNMLTLEENTKVRL